MKFLNSSARVKCLFKSIDIWQKYYRALTNMCILKMLNALLENPFNFVLKDLRRYPPACCRISSRKLKRTETFMHPWTAPDENYWVHWQVKMTLLCYNADWMKWIRDGITWKRRVWQFGKRKNPYLSTVAVELCFIVINRFTLKRHISRSENCDIII